jgi:hypothetical protein
MSKLKGHLPSHSHHRPKSVNQSVNCGMTTVNCGMTTVNQCMTTVNQMHGQGMMNHESVNRGTGGV